MLVPKDFCSLAGSQIFRAVLWAVVFNSFRTWSLKLLTGSHTQFSDWGKKVQKLLLQSSQGCCIHVLSIENAQWFSSQYLPCCWWEVQHIYVKAASAALPQAIEAFSVMFWAPAPLFAVLESAFAPMSCSCSSGWRKVETVWRQWGKKEESAYGN